MSADVLRRAASLMRERAEAAREWNADVEPGDSLHLWVTDHDPSDPTGQTAMQRLVGGADAPWSEHIAAADPPFMLAVADWLTECAEHLDVDPTEYADGSVCLTAQAGPECSVMEQVLAVACAYLGGAS